MWLDQGVRVLDFGGNINLGIYIDDQTLEIGGNATVSPRVGYEVGAGAGLGETASSDTASSSSDFDVSVTATAAVGPFSFKSLVVGEVNGEVKTWQSVDVAVLTSPTKGSSLASANSKFIGAGISLGPEFSLKGSSDIIPQGIDIANEGFTQISEGLEKAGQVLGAVFEAAGNVFPQPMGGDD